ncbi:methionyl-tRNA formyltransferase, partial [Burkholderia multivorans]
MDIVFAGTPDVAVPALEALVDSEHTVRAVLTRPDAPVGRKRVLTPSPVKARALELGLDVIEADRLRGEVIARLRSLDVDAVAVVAFGAIAGPAALATARLGWFNLHFSLLPSHRGAAPVQRALIAGETVSGVSVFRIDTGMDTGDVLRTRTLPLDQPDAASALAAFAEAGAH